MIYLLILFEYCRIGLFSVGGGLATIPFIYNLASRTHWFEAEQIPNYFAAAQIVPGAIGVNLGAYTGMETAGIFGAFTAAFGLIFPSIVIIIIVSHVYERFKQNKITSAVFEGIRPASLGLIVSAFLSLSFSMLYDKNAAAFFAGIKIKEAVIFAAVTALVFIFKKHPALYIALGAAAGIAAGL